MKQTKAVTLIATVQPPDAKGKRKIAVAAAPEGQMPARTFTGLYADLHALIDQAWIAALTERPATVAKSAPAKAKPKKRTVREQSASEPAEETETVDSITEDTESTEPDIESEVEPVSEPETEDEQLPLIEGDTQ